ncbi:NDP-hexose 2,3-dehydratase family protein [Streptomyces sp. NPDC000410]|uniref:NDP-hexose 2,3-dehydratase family protein n=1 Tax=Streptomyces sp. NPDC000410 TaxID=3154254 RepID=UPI0033223FB2
MSSTVSEAMAPAGIQDWLGRCGSRTRVRRIPLDALEDWHTDPATGDLRHATGRFFTVRGLDVSLPGAPVPHWSQPVLDQPETGILGILLTYADGVPHLLMQAKAEPGNPDGAQLSPTVQATRSNYTRAHGGRAVPYLEHFLDPDPRRIVADVCQSEQGSWFLGKRNRNMIVEVDAARVDVLDSWRWLPLAQVRLLLAVDDLVNMDARSVLACLPYRLPYADAGPARHPTGELAHWLHHERRRCRLKATPRPLAALPGWRRTDEAVVHRGGRFFRIIGLEVEAVGREVGRWTQPMLQPYGTGVAAFLTTLLDGVPHVLLRAGAEAGHAHGVELAPTVQCTPANLDALPPAARPRFLDEVLAAPPDRILFDSTLSEEGGRFHHARTRYLLVATDDTTEPEGFRWATPPQLTALLGRSRRVNVEARTLLACVRSLNPAE